MCSTDSVCRYCVECTPSEAWLSNGVVTVSHYDTGPNETGWCLNHHLVCAGCEDVAATVSESSLLGDRGLLGGVVLTSVLS